MAGGLLALETAVCLEAAGHEVGVVFLFDASHPQQFKAGPPPHGHSPLE